MMTTPSFIRFAVRQVNYTWEAKATRLHISFPWWFRYMPRRAIELVIQIAVFENGRKAAEKLREPDEFNIALRYDSR